VFAGASQRHTDLDLIKNAQFLVTSAQVSAEILLLLLLLLLLHTCTQI
jgi:hypothetical protein